MCLIWESWDSFRDLKVSVQLNIWCIAHLNRSVMVDMCHSSGHFQISESKQITKQMHFYPGMKMSLQFALTFHLGLHHDIANLRILSDCLHICVFFLVAQLWRFNRYVLPYPYDPAVHMQLWCFAWPWVHIKEKIKSEDQGRNPLNPFWSQAFTSTLQASLLLRTNDCECVF